MLLPISTFFALWIAVGVIISFTIICLADSGKIRTKEEIRVSTFILTILLWPAAIIFMLWVTYQHLTSSENPNRQE